MKYLAVYWQIGERSKDDKITAFYNLASEEFGTTESSSSFYADKSSLLCAGLISVIAEQPTDNAPVEIK